MKMKTLLEKIDAINSLKKRIEEAEQMERQFGPNQTGKQHILNLKSDLNELEQEEI